MAIENIQKYLEEISQYSLLPVKEVKILQKKVLGGDKSAEQKLYQHHLRIVVQVVKKYIGVFDADTLALIEAGNQGLQHAITKFHGKDTDNPTAQYIVWIHHGIIQKGINEAFLDFGLHMVEYQDSGNFDQYFAHFFLLSLLSSSFFHIFFLNDQKVKKVLEMALSRTFSMKGLNSGITKKNFLHHIPYLFKMLRPTP